MPNRTLLHGYFRLCSLLVAVVCATHFCGAALRADEPVGPASDAAQIQKWVEQLGDDDYQARQRAGERLTAAGPAAIAAVAAAAVSDNLEVSWRAGDVLLRIGAVGDRRTSKEITAVLQQLTAGGGKGDGAHLPEWPAGCSAQMSPVPFSAAEMQRRWRRLRRGRAATQLTKLGGELIGFEPTPDPSGDVVIGGSISGKSFSGTGLEYLELSTLPPAPGEEGYVAPDPTVGAGETFDWMQQRVVRLGGNFNGSDDDLALLADLAPFTKLEIHDRDVSAAAVAHLAEIDGLKTLLLQNARYDGAAIARLKTARPKLQVWVRGKTYLGIAGRLVAGGYQLTTVAPGSPAQRAGLRAGDVLTALDGSAIEDLAGISLLIGNKPVGGKLRIDLIRDDRPLSVTATLGAKSNGR